jgi:hypothetical protein
MVDSSVVRVFKHRFSLISENHYHLWFISYASIVICFRGYSGGRSVNDGYCNAYSVFSTVNYTPNQDNNIYYEWILEN